MSFNNTLIHINHGITYGKIGLTYGGCSLGARPTKNWKGGSGKLAGVEVYTAPGMKAHFQLAFD